MTSRAEYFVQAAVFWCITVPVAFCLGSLFLTLRAFGRIRVINPKHVPSTGGRLLVVSNHPSLWETIIVPMLFFPGYMWRPDQNIPWCTPSTKTFVDRWYLFALKRRFIMVPRDDQTKSSGAFRKMLRVLKDNHRLILFPEGGRTFKGEAKYYTSRNTPMREWKNGVAELVIMSGTPVLPVWIDGADRVLPNDGSWFPRLWRRMTVVVGEPVQFNRMNRNPYRIRDTLISTVLALESEIQ